jgi:hypothetical protein
MKFLPIENITYKTTLKEEEVIHRLVDITEPEKTFRFGMSNRGATKLYEGQISGREFNIKRIIDYRNSFLPQIKGNIEKSNEGVTIKVKMRPSTFVIVFLCIFLGGGGLSYLAFLPQIFSNSAFNLSSLIPFGVLLLAYGIIMGSFTFESKKSKNDLQKILDAEIIEE